MKITYKNPGFEYSLDSISMFQSEEETSFWTDSLFYFYPQLEKEKLIGKNKKQYLSETLFNIYEETKDEIEEKVSTYNKHFLEHKEQIEDALSQAFQVDSRSLFNDLTGNITLNPICPRYLEEHCFDVFYKNSERGALGVSLHEVIHYFWFYVWNTEFGDSYQEYERPSLKWILSEMVVESIMSDERLCSINPYFPHEDGGGCIYPYFFDMTIDGKPILNTIDQMYKNNKITDFMKQSYEYCKKHERTIRAHIEKAEM